MNKYLPYILVGVAILLGVLFIPGKKRKHFDNRITLKPMDKVPYGTNVSYTLLHKLFPSAEVTINRNEPGSWKNLNTDTGKQVLMIVAKNFDPTENELDAILSFAQKGNYVFISAIQYNSMASEVFKIRQEFSSTYDKDDNDNDVAQPDSFHISLDTGMFHQPVVYNCPGSSYDNFFIDYDSSITYPLGFGEKGNPNLLAMKTINGTIYLHSAPLALSNFFMLYHNNHHYLENMAALVPVKPTSVVWDEYYLFSHNKNSDNSKKGILSVILGYPNFQWAFWLALIILGIYILTETKRRQRAIPDYSRPLNEHMEFITTVGKLYYEKADHLNLASKMTQFFLEHVRSKYKISTNHINADFAKSLVAKTGLSQEEANAIVTHIQNTQLGSVNAEDLESFYHHLENFYKIA